MDISLISVGALTGEVTVYQSQFSYSEKQVYEVEVVIKSVNQDFFELVMPFEVYMPQRIEETETIVIEVAGNQMDDESEQSLEQITADEDTTEDMTEDEALE